MGTSAQETVGDIFVEKTSSIIIPNYVQPFAGSPGEEGFQEHTHFFPTPGSLSRSYESFSDVSTLTMHALEAGGNQENPIEAFKRLVDSQEGFSELSPILPCGQTNNFDDFFQQLKSILVGLYIFKHLKMNLLPYLRFEDYL